MPPDPNQQDRNIDLAVLAKLLLDAFDIENFRRLFLYSNNPKLKPIKELFGPDDNLPRMIDRVLEKCEKDGLLPDLLEEVKRANLYQYERYQERLYRSSAQTSCGVPATQAEVPAQPVPRRRRPVWVWVAAALGAFVILALFGAGIWSLAGGWGNRATATLPALDGATAVSTTGVAAVPTTATATFTPISIGTPTATPTQTVAPTETSTATSSPTPQVKPRSTVQVLPGPTVPVEGYSALWSPDGRNLFVGGMEIYVLDTTAGFKQLRSFGSYSGDNGIALSPDGKTVAVFRTGVKLYDAESGAELHTLFEENSVRSATCGAFLAFSPDGARLAVVAGDTIKLYDVANGKEVKTLVARGATSIAYAHDSASLYVGGYYGSGLLDLESGEQVFSIGSDSSDALCLALSTDGTLLATAGTSGNAITLWDATSGRQLRTLAGNEGGTTRLAFSPDGQVLASAGNDVKIRLWDTAKGTELASVVGHAEVPQTLSFSPDGAMLASTDQRGEVRLWQLVWGSGTVEPSATCPIPGPSPTPVAPSAEAISPANAGKVKLLRSSEAIGGQVAWSPDGRWLAIAGYDIAWVDAATLKGARTFPVDGSLSDLAVSPDGAILALQASGAKLFEIASGAELHSLYETNYSRSATCGSFLAFSPDGATLAVQEGEVVKLYDVAGGGEVNTLVARGANAITFSADGRSVYAGGTYGLDALDACTGEAVHLLGDISHSVACLTASADGALLAVSSSSNRSIIIWDAAKGRQVRTWTLPGEMPNRMALSPNGQVLATTGGDLMIRLWDVATGSELASLSGPTDEVNSLAFSPDGATLASAGRDWVVRFWGLQP
jgi:WD40 repeat protein